MLEPRTRWEIQKPSEEKAKWLSQELDIPLLIANLLAVRGIETIEEAQAFLKIDIDQFHDPFLMDGMKESVERIHKAVESQEKILIFGDYDADGVSSTTVMYYALKELGADFDYYIPNRFTEGYGPNEPALRKAKEEGYSLVVTVDTGISAVHEAAVAKKIGLDFIITDHHEAPPVLPDAYSIINPKKPGCTYPFSGLAGVGVAFKVAHALHGKPPMHLLDYACIGTIADLVPLIDENRVIAKMGIEALSKTDKIGLQELLKAAGLYDKELSAEDVGFAIGPRVNAAGRLGSAMPVVELFTSSDREESAMLAQELDSVNKERQGIVNEITKEAIAMVEEQFPPEHNEVLVLAKEGWNPGVIGIVASRLVEKFYRPTIVLCLDPEKETAKGSARSIKGFDMFENLSESRDILPHFGGHPMAAGMTLSMHDVNELRNRLIKQAKTCLTQEDFLPVTSIDLTAALDEISLETVEMLSTLAPFGVGNPSPRILIEEVPIREMKKIGSQSNHLKLQVGNGEMSVLDCIGFQKGSLLDEMTPYSLLSLVGQIQLNEWNGYRKPQLLLEDLSVSHFQLFDYRGLKDAGKRLIGLPDSKTCYIAFDKSTLQELGMESLASQTIGEDELFLQPKDAFQDKYIVFLDVPTSLSRFSEWLETIGEPARIYAVFHQSTEHFFTTLPNRDHFKWFYAFLAKRKTFNVRKDGAELAKWKGWSKETIDFMSKVFFELEFVTIDNGVISINSKPSKRELDSSETYQKKFEQADIENQLVYSSYHSLKSWFTQQTRPKASL
ncbi:single-stranded-DNA-specific exonuclease RecJ [Fictibacillus barbaricus]|uniref:Single-stranded-DNA-specific exonuclease RecJ n=1 Tax=Fictibacillus barbaricus TaxID=182136 RepID=A0ABS2ZLL3_9BACL|nr:single-stranded-DNA-specific exonuclease RecJ [Fictibacillus barbaricus]MBN3547489.1 single-stranded-DNA-specific exonuclease RecJ [Fictibacillus barbaricus]GGB49336.1 single-stranded-DNA-specific exonuclease [Fictibacillus barbaricus]